MNERVLLMNERVLLMNERVLLMNERDILFLSTYWLNTYRNAKLFFLCVEKNIYKNIAQLTVLEKIILFQFLCPFALIQFSFNLFTPYS